MPLPAFSGIPSLITGGSISGLINSTVGSIVPSTDKTLNYTPEYSKFINEGVGLERYRQYIRLGLTDAEASALTVADYFTGDKFADQKAARSKAVKLSSTGSVASPIQIPITTETGSSPIPGPQPTNWNGMLIVGGILLGLGIIAAIVLKK